MITVWDAMFLQSRTAFQLTIVTKWEGGCYKVGQLFCYKVGQMLLQSGTDVTKWDRRCYKVGQVLQSETIVTKWALTVAQGASRIL